MYAKIPENSHRKIQIPLGMQVKEDDHSIGMQEKTSKWGFSMLVSV